MNGYGNKGFSKIIIFMLWLLFSRQSLPSYLRVVLYSIILIKFKRSMLLGKESVNALKQREKKERNVMRMVVAILTGSALCWGPIIIALLVVFRTILNFYNVYPKVGGKLKRKNSQPTR